MVLFSVNIATTNTRLSFYFAARLKHVAVSARDGSGFLNGRQILVGLPRRTIICGMALRTVRLSLAVRPNPAVLVTTLAAF